MGTSKLLALIIVLAVAAAAGFFAYSVAGAPKINTASLFAEEKTVLPPRLPPAPKRDKPQAHTCENGSIQNGFCVIK